MIFEAFVHFSDAYFIILGEYLGAYYTFLKHICLSLTISQQCIQHYEHSQKIIFFEKSRIGVWIFTSEWTSFCQLSNIFVNYKAFYFFKTTAIKIFV